MRSETVFQRPKSTVRLRFSSSETTVQLPRMDTSQFPVHGNGSLTGLRRGACICMWLLLLGAQNGFMVSLSPGEQLMRVRKLAASEWGNSTRYPSNRGRGGGGCRRRTRPSLSASVSGAFFNILINNISPTRN